MISVVQWILFLVSLIGVNGAYDEEMHFLPKLFHLDDYDRCLSREDGLYCVGTFELAPETENNTLYSLIEEHQKEPFSFDRRLLHRGYCLSTRCPSKELNTSLRFEQCANKHLQKYALTARLKTLSYCKNHAKHKARETQAPDWPQKIFIYVVYFILFLNVLGTFYDVCTDGKKNCLLVAWSLPSNWRLLTSTDGVASSKFAAVAGSKITMHLIVIYAHSTLMHYGSYVYNPGTLQKVGHSPLIVTIRNGTSLVQVFILVSSFLTSYNILVTAQRSAMSARLVSKWILKRFLRIAPVYLFLTGYAATWWPRASDGPIWSPLVEAESAICRKKFWTHLLFVNNLVNATELCLGQSWAMATEIQLYFVSLLVTVVFIKLRVRATPVLGVMFAASCLFNVTLAYVAGLVPMVKIIVPENMRVLFRGSRSFFHLHMSPWSNLPACIFGLLLGHIYFEQQNKMKAKEVPNDNNKHGNIKQVTESKKENNEHGFKENGLRNRKYLTDERNKKVQETTNLKENEGKEDEVNSEENKSIGKSADLVKPNKKKAPFLLRYGHCFSLPAILTWAILGAHIQKVDSKIIVAFYVGMERLIFSVLHAWLLFQSITVKGDSWGRLMRWRGWTVPSRLLYSVVMVHWCINLTIVATRPQPVVSSLLNITIDWLATLFYSFLAALPVSLLVEMPVKKVGDAILS